MPLLNTAGNLLFKVGCLKAAATVIIASAGGHKYEWEADKKLLYSNAVKYSMFNSVGIIIASLTTASYVPPVLFLGATAMFCVPSWYRCFTDSKKLHFLMPYGGAGMILGWVALAFL